MAEFDSLRNGIYKSLDLRETDDLIEIWQSHDTSEWTELAFDAIKDILQKRLGSLPAEIDPDQNVSDDDDEPDDESDEDLIDPEMADDNGEAFIRAEKSQACPFCKSKNIFAGELNVLGNESKIVLKTAPLKSSREEDIDVGYNQIIALACEDCGHVFFMLKDFV